jgi:hypothetical protein
VTRRAAAGAAAVLLLALVIVRQPLGEIPRRARFLRAFAAKDLPVRRLGGSGTAFDRRYFSFLENARRSLPPATAGVAIAGAPVDDAHVFLANYAFAPLPVGFSFADGGPPRGWVIAEYGAHPAPDGVLARFPEGVLLGGAR